MSEARMKANVLKILASPAIRHINFRISGNHIYNERFKKLAVAIKVGLVGFTVLKDTQAKGRYFHQANILMLNEKIGASGTISNRLQQTVVHECFHAVCDMEMLEGISPTQEETCGYIAMAIYEKYHFGKSQYKKDHPMTAMLATLKGNPGYELQGDPAFGDLYQRAYEIYAKNNSEWGRDSNIHDGL